MIPVYSIAGGVKMACFMNLRSILAVFAVCACPLANSSAQAADFTPETCSTWATTFGGGYILAEEKVDFFDVTLDNSAVFGEAAALYHLCETRLNLQLDAAIHEHSIYDGDNDNSFDATQWHVGGILFWRDSNLGLLGVDVSRLDNDFTDVDRSSGSWRFGLRSEYFATEMFTLGAGAGYVDARIFDDTLHGFDANAWATLYPLENAALTARFDLTALNGDYELDRWAIGTEGEYLLPEIPVSLFAGGRYARLVFDDNTDEPIEDMQIYGGLNFYFGSSGSLAQQHRTNTLDNTNVHFERLPIIFY